MQKGFSLLLLIITLGVVFFTGIGSYFLFTDTIKVNFFPKALNPVPPQKLPEPPQPSSPEKPMEESELPENLTENYLIFYEKDNAIFETSLDGKRITRIVDSPNKLGFAGFSDQDRTFYYSELKGTQFFVYKKTYPDGKATELFKFKGSDKNQEFFASNVQTNSNGTYIAYSDETGISLYDTKTKKSKRILSNKRCNANAKSPWYQLPTAQAVSDDCYSYYFPIWDPDGTKLLLRKILYEGSRNVVVNPFASTVTEIDLAFGGVPIWSPLGNVVASYGSGAYSHTGLALVKDFSDPLPELVLDQFPEFKESPVFSANWVDGKIAFVYSRPDQNGIAVYDTTNNTIEKIMEVKDQVNEWSVVWLPDQLHLVVTDHEKNVWLINTKEKKKYRLPLTVDTIVDVL